MDPIALRRSVYTLLITVAAGIVGSHIASVVRVFEPYHSRDEKDPNDKRGTWRTSRPEPEPTHGPNDRSRWDTVRALVDEGTYAIGRREKDPEAKSGYKDSGICFEDGWGTIDMVLHPQRQEYYSSKPPLLPTLAAGEYWLLKKLFGWTITGEQGRWLVVRTILLTFNALPFIVYLFLLSRLLERHAQTDWGRFFILAAACFGTFVTSFIITFNNHNIAAYSCLFTLYGLCRILEGEYKASLFLLTGFMAAFTACNELPAASFAGLAFLLLLIASWRLTLIAALPAALLVVGAFELTNYLSIGEWIPAYEKFGSEWYEFKGSYWKPGPDKTGIDWAHQHESRAVYAFHILIGHHGWLSLSPIYLLAVAGMLYSLVRLRENRFRWIGVLSLVTTAVILVFYTVIVTDRARNYGGWTNGLRWLMWLTPLWLLSMVPAVDWLGRFRWGRTAAYTCLAISVFSASFRPWNPWIHPWLYNLLESWGWINY